MRSLLVFTACVGAVCIPAVAQEVPNRLLPVPERTAQERLTGRYLTLPMKASPELAPRAAAPATIPFWASSTVISGTTYNYQMVGQSPFTTLTNQTTTIAAPIVPLILTFSDGTVFDPTATNACSSKTPESLVQSSPIFNNSAYTVGGTSVGTTTYHDFFQRANFWQYTKPGAPNPNYHLLLTTSASTPVKITVPAASGSTFTTSCGKRGEVDLNFLDPYLQSTAFSQLFSNGVLPSQLPIFLLYNVVAYQGTVSSCCILGYHSAFNNPNYANAVQTYVVADFDTSGAFTNISDVAPLSHEIGEWIDDPIGNNPTPPWGNIGQVTGCQTNLEVGDPLSGTVITVTGSNAYTYHLQELAFMSWFYRTTPSMGVNGWYSSNGTLTSGAGPCSPTTTTLSITPTTMALGASATVKVTVAPTSGSGTPTGSVSLVSGTTTLDTYTLSAGAVNATVSNLPGGSYPVVASYAGDITYDPSSSAVVSVTVGAPGTLFAPISLAFGNANVGSASASQVVKLTNNGTAPLTGVAVSLTGASPGDYSQTNTCASNLAVNASCNITVTLKPTAAGSRTASIAVSDNATGSPQTVPLSGTGVAAPAISFSPGSMSFSGTVGVAGSAQTVTVKNTGSAALTVNSVNITGTNSGDFTDTTTCTGSIAVNGTCTISVKFAPLAAGSRTASISVGDNATGSPQSVSLTGAAVAAVPVVQVSVTSLSFGSVNVGSASAVQAVTVKNAGAAALTINSVNITGTNSGDFTDTTTCTGSIAVNSTCIVTVTFKPTAAGARAASISIGDNATGSPQSVALTGTGVTPIPVVQFSVTSLAFGAINVGSSSATQAVTVKNVGTSALTVNSVNITGTNSGDFTDTTTCTGSIAVNGTCTLTVTFKPTAGGARSASISIGDNAAGSPQTVSLTGTGVVPAPAVTLSPTSLAFGQVTVANSSSKNVTITNSGTAALTLTLPLTITGTGFTQTNTCTASLAVNASCTVTVKFLPTAKTSYTGTLSVADNASGSPQTVSLSGSGK